MRIPKKLVAWQAAMRKGPARRQVIANIVNEPNVPAPVSRAVFAQLGRLYSASGDAGVCFVEALNRVEESALAGPTGQPRSMALFTRFTPLSRIADQEEARRRGYSESKLLAKPQRLRSLRKMRLGFGARQVVWAADHDSVEKDFQAGATMDEVVDRLGLPPSPSAMVQITYSIVDVPPPIKVPTTFDAGLFAEFRPAPKGARSGMTRPVSGKSHGYPECNSSAKCNG